MYGLRDPDSHRVRYVGVTYSPSARLSNHVSRARQAAKRGRLTTPKDDWILSLLAQGKRPQMVLLECLPMYPELTCGAYARRAEETWIRWFAVGDTTLLNIKNRPE